MNKISINNKTQYNTFQPLPAETQQEPTTIAKTNNCKQHRTNLNNQLQEKTPTDPSQQKH